MMALAPAMALSLLLADPPPGTEGPYRVGPGDVLEVVVEGRPDLGRMPTVQTTGTVWLPGTGEVEVRGLTTDDAAARIAAALAGDAPPPRVSVRVREYHSQFVWVRGAVRRPGRRALRPGTRLVDALLDAGGFAPGATGSVVVERAAGMFEDGSARLALRFSGGAPTPEELSHLALALRPGDVVSAAAPSWARIDGVGRPGRYPLEEGMTVSRLVEQAGGPARRSQTVFVVRRAAPAEAAQEIEVDLAAIREGRATDVILQDGDAVAAREKRP
jgi:polysaccharide export outer membrane protein